MHLLGLSGGRKMGNSEVLLREALLGAKEVGGVEIELIRLMDLKIKPPLGEHAHMKGKGQSDHASFLNKKIRASDGLIVACPAYALTPPGFVINIRDRVSLRGLPQKIRPAAMIAVGGTDWTSLMLPLIYTVLPHGECILVDQILVQYEAPLAQVTLNQKALARARKLGRNVAEAMQKPIDKVKYLSEEYFACPLCHQNLLIVRDDKVECAICDVRGTLKLKDGKIKVSFSKAALKTYRWGPEGAKRHGSAIMAQNKAYKEKVPEIKKLVKKYEAAIPVTKPPRAFETEVITREVGQTKAEAGKTLLDL